MSDNENQVNEEPIEEPILYRTSSDGKDIRFNPGLPHDKLMQELLNNRQIVEASPHIVQKVLNMEWKWFERRVIKWLGDTEYSRKLQQSLRNHIKNEKKWVERGAKAEEVQKYQG